MAGRGHHLTDDPVGAVRESARATAVEARTAVRRMIGHEQSGAVVDRDERGRVDVVVASVARRLAMSVHRHGYQLGDPADDPVAAVLADIRTATMPGVREQLDPARLADLVTRLDALAAELDAQRHPRQHRD